MKHPQNRFERKLIDKKKSSKKKGDPSNIRRKLELEQVKEQEAEDALREYQKH